MNMVFESVAAPLPIDQVLPHLEQALSSSRQVIVSAPPGAGKTTRIPIALRAAHWLGANKILMLEPRRLAARRAAEYMAEMLGEKTGATVGFRIRGESRVGPDTRIEVVTEGILTRMLHAHPDLPGVGMVIFDEFHERSIHADLGLALTLDAQERLRLDLRILIMSATLDGVAVSRVLDHAPVVDSPGASFPVETVYLSSARSGSVEPAAAETVRRALRETSGDILVFLPGVREIKVVERLLQNRLPEETHLHTLFSDAGPARQQPALAPARRGTRKVILSTSVAETSLTIDGVSVVIDCGLSRSSRFDPRRGMSGLVTVPVSAATADQRRGRAGRQSPGVCYRLWTEVEQRQLLPHAPAEILTADLAPLALDLACWEESSPSHLRFIDQPPEAHLQRARQLLTDLDALDEKGAVTPHGREMSGIPVHPRLSHAILSAGSPNMRSLACDIAALLEERDILLREGSAMSIDLATRLQALATGSGADPGVRVRVVREARNLRHLTGTRTQVVNESHAGVVLALAFPERVAQRRPGKEGRFLLSGGTGGVISPESSLAREQFLAVGEIDGIGKEAKIFLAAPLREEELRLVLGEKIRKEDQVFWSAQDEAVVARRVECLGALILAEKPITANGEDVERILCQGIRSMGLEVLPWERQSRSLAARSEWVRLQHLGDSQWPDLTGEVLMNTLESWLRPFLAGMSRRSHLARLDMLGVIRSLLTRRRIAEVDRLAPEMLTVPTGSRIRLDYNAGESPILAVKLQEMFGQVDTPKVGGGKIPVLIHLLSPSGRPVAVTSDLRSFWLHVYPEVRKEMRGRYPKHDWSENPLKATPHRGTMKVSRSRR
jgi:ATP-dependent helicase HrpB